MLRAASVADLAIDGLLRDRDGRAERTNTTPNPPFDPFLAEVLGDISLLRMSRWYDLISHRAHRGE